MSTLEVKAIQAPTGYDLQMPAGHILQVVQAQYSTNTTTTSTSFVTSGLNATITPSSTSNKILVSFSIEAYTNSTDYCYVTAFRGTVSGTNLGNSVGGLGFVRTDAYVYSPISNAILDSPSTTSAQTYTVGFRSNGAGTVGVCYTKNAVATLTLMEVQG